MDKEQKKQILEYENHLISWNKTHNLVSKSQASNLKEHIDDSLIISPLLGDQIMDLGSGGGLPGIPLAICNPKKQLYLVESSEKKSSFLLNTISKLKLNNAQVINKRIEDIEDSILPESFDLIARAVGSTETILKMCENLLKRHRIKIKLMKTLQQFQEETLPAGYTVIKIDKFKLKAKDKTRILVTIEPDRNNG